MNALWSQPFRLTPITCLRRECLHYQDVVYPFMWRLQLINYRCFRGLIHRVFVPLAMRQEPVLFLGLSERWIG